MKPSIFESAYADQYDLLYSSKDYESECDLIETVFRQHVGQNVKTVLDLGCGTGNHLFPLARRGYHVDGVDLSADMLARAREKASSPDMKLDHPPSFHLSDIKEFNSTQKYDAVLMMFAVLGYQLENLDVVQALDTVRRHLKPDGVFVFDVWYGPAVLAIKPSDRLMVIETGDGQLLRFASGSLDTYQHLADVNYHLWRIQNNEVVRETTELHRMRYFFAQELSHYLEEAGMKMTMLSSFPDISVTASEASWNVLGVARSASQA